MMPVKLGRACWIVCGCFGFLAAETANSLPAFPGAEGAGADAVGGRGGTIFRVTNLNDSGAGSLRTGISAGNRTIIFDVSGTINLSSDLKISKNNITIAGQTAPGDGITLKRRLTSVQNCRDVVVRFIRCRPGDADNTFQDDSFHVVNGTNIMVDHVSASWSVDECLSVTHSTNVTVQWSMIAESLKNSQHDKGSHGYGTLLRYGNGELTFHHNLYAHHDSRNPRLGDNLKLDFVNNVIYNWGGRAGYSGDYSTDLADNPDGFTNYLNYVNNYLIAGPSTGPSSEAFRGGTVNTVIFQSGNLIDSNKNPLLDGANTGWNMFTSLYTQSGTRYPVPAINADSAAAAYERVIAFVGASGVRDEVDTRLIGTVRNHTGRLVDAVGPSDQATDYVTNNINGTNYVFVRGWPELVSTAPAPDSDNDGIPNYFETAMGWNPTIANNNHTNADGYTDLEWYLNWLAVPHAIAARNLPITVNLRSLTGDNPDLAFTGLNSTNGTVTLLPDGITAQFFPATNVLGLTTFEFNVTNAVDHVAFGPVAVAVLVTPNAAPVLAPIADRTIIAGATLTFTNVATDADQPSQTLTFSVAGAPEGLSVGAANGVLTWRPTIAKSNSTNSLSVIVTDNGIPNLSATQSFSILVMPPAQPQVQPFHSGGSFGLQVTGDAGPDYHVQASTNLFNWVTIFSTNSPTLPLVWTDPENTNFDQRFYRILLGP